MAGPVLEDKFSTVGLFTRTVHVQLHPFSICISASSKQCCSCSNLDTEIPIEDVLGVSASSSRSAWRSTEDAPKYLHIVWTTSSKASYKGLEMNKLNQRVITLGPSSSQQQNLFKSGRLEQWVKCIQYYSKGLASASLETICNYSPVSQKPILFLVNPRSGSGKAESIFRQRLVPLLEKAKRNYQLMLTSKPNHGRELMSEMSPADISKWCAIVVVSGDGLLHEVINGIFERSDWATTCQIPIGIIPGGSGNGLARSVAYSKQELHADNGILQSAVGVIRGETKPLDLVCVETSEGPIYSFLSIGYALMADIDIESECLRFVGEIRFPLWSFVRIASLRLYRAKLSYLPADGHNTTEQMRRAKREGSFLKRRRSLKPEENKGLQIDKLDRERYFSVSETNYDSALCDSSPANSCREYESEPESEQNTFHSLKEFNDIAYSKLSKVNTPDLGVPSLDEPVPSNWKTIEDEFAILYAVSQSHITSTCCVSPFSAPSDGVIWISMVRKGYFPSRKIPRVLLAKYLLKSENNGEQAFLDGVEMIPVKSFRLEPADTRGKLTVDGEVIKTEKIQATVLPSIANILS